MNLLAYALNAINLFDSDRPRHKRLDIKRLARSSWAWGKRHPQLATGALGALALLILFGWLFL